MRARLATLLLAAGVALGGCAYGGLSVGTGYGYGPYGGYGPYSGYGYGSYDPYDPYFGNYYGYGSRYGYGYGSPYWGWYDGFYYPGTGYYVYDRYRNSHRMTDAQRKYWEWRRRGSQSGSGVTSRIIQNWADFQNGGTTTTTAVRQRSIEPTQTVRTRSEIRQRVQRSDEPRTLRSRSRSETRSSSRGSSNDNARRSSEDQ